LFRWLLHSLLFFHYHHSHFELIVIEDALYDTPTSTSTTIEENLFIFKLDGDARQ
jgi:hypothetical protein